jgi:hypothetical protein
MPRPKKFREVVKLLRKHDKRFEIHENRGKGSERIIFHPEAPSGRSECFPIKCHGDGTELRKGVLVDLIRRFTLPKDIFD